jgi:hypothetical protein
MNVQLVLGFFTTLAATVWIDVFKEIKGYKKDKLS